MPFMTRVYVQPIFDKIGYNYKLYSHGHLPKMGNLVMLQISIPAPFRKSQVTCMAVQRCYTRSIVNHLISRCSAVCMSATNRMLCSFSTSRCQSVSPPFMCSCWYVSLRSSKSFAILAYWSDISFTCAWSTSFWTCYSGQKNSSKIIHIIMYTSLDRLFKRHI